MASSQIAIESSFVNKSFEEAAEEFGHDDGAGVYFAVEPFDALYMSEDGKHVVWEKDFFTGSPLGFFSQEFTEYLSLLMPLLYQVSSDGGSSTQVTLSWVTPNTSTLGEQVKVLSETIVDLVNSVRRVEELHASFHTPENLKKIDSMKMSRGYISPEVMAQTILNGYPASVAQGEL